jgi:hypothetical protein
MILIARAGNVSAGSLGDGDGTTHLGRCRSTRSAKLTVGSRSICSTTASMVRIRCAASWRCARLSRSRSRATWLAQSSRRPASGHHCQSESVPASCRSGDVRSAAASPKCELKAKLVELADVSAVVSRPATPLATWASEGNSAAAGSFSPARRCSPVSATLDREYGCVTGPTCMLLVVDARAAPRARGYPCAPARGLPESRAGRRRTRPVRLPRAGVRARQPRRRHFARPRALAGPSAAVGGDEEDKPSQCFGRWWGEVAARRRADWGSIARPTCLSLRVPHHPRRTPIGGESAAATESRVFGVHSCARKKIAKARDRQMQRGNFHYKK